MGSRQAARRRFLKEGATLAGLAVAAPAVSGQSLLQGGPPADAEHPLEFGERSRFVRAKRIPITQVGHADMHGDPNGFDALTPLDQLSGTITPADLHYVSQHQNAPEDIDPREHRLLISGMVDRPLIFTLDELKRLPAVSRIHYIECIANRPNPREQTLNDLHGMVACSEWTGVLLSVLLKEAGVQDGATWVLGESADKVGLGTNIPFAKAMDDVIVAYAQNGEPVRPHQGFPLRLVVPGFEGKYHVKWLKQVRALERPYMTYWEQSHFTNYPRREPLSYYLEQGPKSVITFPAAGREPLRDRGFYMISGLAWSGCGAVSRVEVSADGGQTWKDAEIQGPAQRVALTRFQLPWTWDGQETLLQSRCTDDQGQVQPTAAEHDAFWDHARPPHGNPIQPWRITGDGRVHNAL